MKRRKGIPHFEFLATRSFMDDIELELRRNGKVDRLRTSSAGTCRAGREARLYLVHRSLGVKQIRRCLEMREVGECTEARGFYRAPPRRWSTRWQSWSSNPPTLDATCSTPADGFQEPGCGTGWSLQSGRVAIGARCWTDEPLAA